MLKGLIREMRPHQWYKQSVLLLGIFFSRNVFDIFAWRNVVVAVAAFTAVAGATYIFNDLRDLEEDRNHPVKSQRPIASGQLSPLLASAFGVLLVVGGLGAAYWLGPLFILVLLAYLVQNFFYSFYLKEIVLVDVILVAVGFVLRAVAGVVAISVSLSPWLIVCTFLLALMLAFGKRAHELETVDDPSATRRALDTYVREELDQLLTVTTATLLMSYALYTFFGAGEAMMLTLPFAFFGVFRYHHLVHSTGLGGMPEHLLTDKAFVANLALWVLVTAAVLYSVPSKLVRLVA